MRRNDVPDGGAARKVMGVVMRERPSEGLRARLGVRLRRRGITIRTTVMIKARVVVVLGRWKKKRRRGDAVRTWTWRVGVESGERRREGR
jgi:hypothetical protein